MNEFETRAPIKTSSGLHLPGGAAFGERLAATLIVAESLDAVPRFTDAFPRLGRPPYARFTQPFPQTYNQTEASIKTPQNESDVQQENVVKIIIPIITFGDGADPTAVARQIDRGMQRVGQFKRVVGYISEWEDQIRRGIPPLYSYLNESGGQNNYQVTPDYLETLKEIAFSLFAGELAQEPFTSELAKPLLPKQITEEEKAILEADRLIAEHRFKNAKQISVSTQEIKCLPEPKRPQDSGLKPESDDSPEVGSITAKEQDSKPKEGVFEQGSLIFENILAEVVQILSYDRPSKTAAKYFREVWERPF